MLNYKECAKNKDEIRKAVCDINLITNNVVDNIIMVKHDVNIALELLNDTLEKNLPFMGLEDDQEALIAQTTDTVMVSVKKALGSLNTISIDMDKIKSQSNKF
ncbi:hypothetical protein [Pseudoalteromonas denitrificans]|uniref:Uncharacterized protein n=1 Tax=Pseudoalteromonas denitrificans DSM 6059 TaxID=1123010 RepID=A0A1I1PS29_9GAMM|nr:hypothetical protein [Pseudoalteromonas denitrificans]SFD12701.1 hypothetical protein SAMN02745724_03576 [Pseudoalteromonas denitrificans DSM 6059]